jgi:hypothetical protein
MSKRFIVFCDNGHRSTVPHDAMSYDGGSTHGCPECGLGLKISEPVKWEYRSPDRLNKVGDVIKGIWHEADSRYAAVLQESGKYPVRPLFQVPPSFFYPPKGGKWEEHELPQMAQAPLSTPNTTLDEQETGDAA